MADLTITATSVVPDPGAKISQNIAAVNITAGQSVALSSTDSKKVGLYDADGSGEALILNGVALNSANAGQAINVMWDGVLTIGATVAVGTLYFGSDTPGGIRPAADLNSGDSVGLLGIAISTTKIALNIWNTGVVKA
ncbi:conserved hypothetical protein [Hyphomicrobium denitrificans ATCC 51888]|uniref:DUF2190 family protein n=1 Tax=Hyphomicrobium denitrificans (strain ATCC 51888 / DSM 1869 / NCIMB 11706 / TK 0415) TaxID=582899 RepID=D8JVB6_HYPDA|nr:hypothetical protein [Hyphomicrobium denitrificans]ADJ24770.1 conserved hypothetical protein [Hyphomicrobium denitrificans ATCC 51888]